MHLEIRVCLYMCVHVRAQGGKRRVVSALHRKACIANELHSAGAHLRNNQI